MCRALALDLKGQTSASYNMRLNYEKTLLEFENYLSCGQYSADAARGAQRAALRPNPPRLPRGTAQAWRLDLPLAQANLSVDCHDFCKQYQVCVSSSGCCPFQKERCLITWREALVVRASTGTIARHNVCRVSKHAGALPNHEAVVVRGDAGTAPRHDAITEQPRTVIRAMNSHAAGVQQQQLPQQPVMLPSAAPPFGTTEEQRAAQWVQPGWALPPQPVEHTPSMAAASTLGEAAATSVRAPAGCASRQQLAGVPCDCQLDRPPSPVPPAVVRSDTIYTVRWNALGAAAAGQMSFTELLAGAEEGEASDVAEAAAAPATQGPASAPAGPAALREAS